MRRRLKKKSKRIWNRSLGPLFHERSILRARNSFRLSDEAQNLRNGENTYALYRILGNDLPPRHQAGQTLTNLEFILKNEPEFENCEKWWILNRIFDDNQRREIVDCLEAHSQRYIVIDFSSREYAAIAEDKAVRKFLAVLEADGKPDPDQLRRMRLAELRPKVLYAINNNGARNRAIEHGRQRAKWILPWDGNCMLTEFGWAEITQGIEQNGDIPYHIVPMCRLTENRLLLDPGFRPVCEEEPQIVFHARSSETFNEDIPYGRRPKVDLLVRLGLWGEWKHWDSDPWDVPYGDYSEAFGAFLISGGWVGRLHSGNTDQEIGHKSSRSRMLNRDEAILKTIEKLDRTTGTAV